ncbi:hypothetical protein KDW_61520 [Dictyobacter vulcani]|uniref:Uncharacterized protein n=1 Tax=Dictyobacter vulcani TaxID=2607529 RepID=A0A5J4KZJ0_9CHLR|nr:ABC transporter permease subunit [Dictyobacter vulcani]GER91990.1 hypothetical protein KDW_61520 [Dictyobacter vulcani]
MKSFAIQQQATVNADAGSWAHFWLLVRWHLLLIQKRKTGKVIPGCLLGVVGMPVLIIILAQLLNPVVRTGNHIAILPLLMWFTNFALFLFGSILIATMTCILVGSEYSLGTFRQMLTRGASRSQVLFSQVVALTLYILALMTSIFLLVAVLGSLTSLYIHDYSYLSPVLWRNIGLSFVTVAVRLLLFACLAFFLTTVSRSTVVGIAGAWGYLLLESIVTTILLGMSMQLGRPAIYLAAILPGNITTTLNQYVILMLFPQGSGISGTFLAGHSFDASLNWPIVLLIIGAYVVFTIGCSYVLYTRRNLDI